MGGIFEVGTLESSHDRYGGMTFEIKAKRKHLTRAVLVFKYPAIHSMRRDTTFTVFFHF